MNLQDKYTFWSIIKLDWENDLGGDLAEKFRKVLNRQRISGSLTELEIFARKYKKEVSAWHKDYIDKFGHSHFELLTAINSKKTRKKSLLTPVLAILLVVILAGSVLGLNTLQGIFKTEAKTENNTRLAQAPIQYEPSQEKDIFENETQGYKFLYPKGWKAELQEGNVILESPSLQGRLLASVVDNKLELNYEIEGGEEQKNIAKKVGEEIKQSFEVTEIKEFDDDYLRKRYLETMNQPEMN